MGEGVGGVVKGGVGVEVGGKVGGDVGGATESTFDKSSSLVEFPIGSTVSTSSSVQFSSLSFVFFPLALAFLVFLVFPCFLQKKRGNSLRTSSKKIKEPLRHC